MPLTTDEERARKRAYYRRYYWEHRETILARQRTPKYQAMHRKASRRYRDENVSYRGRRTRSLEAEAGRPKPNECEICGNAKQSIMFDHCHQRGVFRGWICLSCNSILGHSNDDPDRLRKLIAYLERTKNLIAPQLELPV